MTILLLAEHDNQNLSLQTANALSAAQAIGGDIDILICGNNVQTVAEQAAQLLGIRKVILSEADYLDHQMAEPVAATILSLADHYDIFMAAATTTGKNIIPRIAAKLDVMQISDIIAVVSPDTFKRPIYAGNAVETVQSTDSKKVITVRTSAFTAAINGGSAPIEHVAPANDPCLTKHLKNEGSKSDRPELNSAKVVISGGRGLGSKEAFQSLLLPLADKFNAALGASRAAVDAGYAPNDWQVGQTGKIVAPDLYIAVGISGAIQHLAGMGDSKIIVAINKDEDAPIMQIADYALVGDLFDLIPELTKSL
ncbi:electron transfer flavoprotein subunit alpha/FixB family protein [Bartonella sp. HY406]|uniref:electron transfer flavoprotein subunit alpha/FixB family protein n=1 Tax=Bartonella sp. HY406 TaxID=2979331 RepID=UPI0021C9F19F|nr:electron transfer flavoprotein subunit alpha/FixB family protein [Bartonella sp. HY406]UXN03616.1 electron transfer flavoprotein subunit alpha/FixB family protein [Bartonella sp. HY406]